MQLLAGPNHGSFKMLTINIETKGRPPYQFEWYGKSRESRLFWEKCEEVAEKKGHDPKNMASEMIRERRFLPKTGP
jgi:hypothetical protein